MNTFDEDLSHDAIFRERINFRFMYFIAAFLGLVAVGMLGALVYHLTVAPIDNEPGLGWMFLSEGLLMAVLAVFVLQFHTLEIILNYQGIVIKFGRIKKFIPWIDIESYQVITTGTLLSSGGWKLGVGKNGWYMMYTVLGKPRVSLKLNTGRIREILFSTANPAEVAAVIKKQTGKDAMQQQPKN
jgi:hypothetical protein